MDRGVTVKIGGREFTVARARLGLFLDLEIALSRLQDAVKSDGTGDIADALFSYLSACIPELDRGVFNEAPWYEIVNAYASLVAMNKIKGDFAIMTRNKTKNRPVPWDYPERVKVVWIHMLADAYNWTKAEIESLNLEEAIGYAQEIQADEQFEREFLYSLSEIAYPYDKASKKSRFMPMKRPLWMVLLKELPRTRLVKAFLPQGMIVTLEDQAHKRVKR